MGSPAPVSCNASPSAEAIFTITPPGCGKYGSVAWATADGTATAGSDYVAASGVVTFAAAPANMVVVTAGFEFDVPVRFDTDLLDITMDIERLGSIAANGSAN